MFFFFLFACNLMSLYTVSQYRFWCLLSTSLLYPQRVESVILACRGLHNLMRIRYPTYHANLVHKEDPASHIVRPGTWQENNPLLALESLPHNTSNQDPEESPEGTLQLTNWQCGMAGIYDLIIIIICRTIKIQEAILYIKQFSYH